MVKVIGVRFRNAGKIYYFDPLDLDIEVGQNVIVETARGIEYGHVLIAPREVDDSKVIQPLKAVIRLATPEDDEIERKNKEKEKDAFKICLEKIAKHKLQMKLIDAEYTFDNNKVLFYFTADGRIDFRELVKDLASVFKTRIELRQIGVRDETKIMGGIGICGRSLCCHTFLSEFAPVSIKMAKEQNLSLNPTKISGVCGRLMCCLKNEEETYEELNSHLPANGDHVTTPEGLRGDVQSVNVLRQLVKVVVTLDNDEKEIREYPAAELKFNPRGKKKDVSAFARVKKNEKALDLGTGTGILPILLEAKYPGLHYTGLEIQEESADMARRSVSYNGLEERIDIVTGDIKEAASIFGAASFGVITTNPPYMIGDHGLKNQNEALYIARHEALCTLDDILRESAKILKVKGRFYMVHRPFRLPEIMTKMCAYGIEPKRMRLVYPYIDKEPNMVLIEGMKGGNPRMQVEPPLVVYQKDGSYTEELLALYGMSPS